MSSDSFDAISKNFDTSFSAAPVLAQIQAELVESEEKTKELKQFIQEKKEVTLEDKEYLQKETKNLIANGKTVLTTLESEIKQGSSPRIYEVYAQLMSTVMGGLREMRELNKMVLDIDRTNAMINDPNPVGTVNITMSSRELGDMLTKARKDSTMNAIDGTFSEVKE